MSFLERAIKRGISRGVSQAVGKAVRTAVEPKATELANKTAARLDSASNNQTVQSTPGGFEGAMANLERAAQGYVTEVSKNMKICPSCETAATADNKFCPRCGTRLPDQTLAESAVCTSCGKQNDLGMKFCSACGTKLPSAIAEEQRAAAQFAGVMAEWDAKLPAYPKWNLGGSDPCIEQDDGYLWFCVTLPNNYLAQKAVEDYRALLRAEGFRPAGQYPSEEILFKKIGDVCYRADTEHCFEGGAESPTIYFSVGEPVGGFDYVKTEPTQAFNFKSLFR